MNSVFIYGLIDPRTNAVRYVGKSVDLSKRLRRHLKETAHVEKTTHKVKWLRQLLALNLTPAVVVLETATIETWEERERHWIAFLPNLTNYTIGGEGGATRSGAKNTTEANRKIGARNKGAVRSTFTRQLLAAANRGKTAAMETKLKMSATRKGRVALNKGIPHTLESRKKMALAQAGRRRFPCSEETKKKISAAKRAKCDAN